MPPKSRIRDKYLRTAEVREEDDGTLSLKDSEQHQFIKLKFGELIMNSWGRGAADGQPRTQNPPHQQHPEHFVLDWLRGVTGTETRSSSRNKTRAQNNCLCELRAEKIQMWGCICCPPGWVWKPWAKWIGTKRNFCWKRLNLGGFVRRKFVQNCSSSHPEPPLGVWGHKVLLDQLKTPDHKVRVQPKRGENCWEEGGGGRKGFNRSSDRKCCCHWGKGTGAESQQHQPHKPTVIHQKTHPKSSRRDENHRITCVRWHLKDYLIPTLWKFLFCEEHQQLFTIHSQKKKPHNFITKTPLSWLWVWI